MTRILTSLPLSIALFVLWIFLVQSASVGNVLLGLGLALFWPAVTRRLADGALRPRKPIVMATLFVRVVGDMLRSNAEVAWALLTHRSSEIRSRLVPIPLELKNPGGLSVLAMIVTFTPGTAWVELSLDKQVLLLHVFSARDEGAVIAAIKGRYERPLREIFE
jgi:multicomponent K+:H+ antiporter subunit E